VLKMGLIAYYLSFIYIDISGQVTATSNASGSSTESSPSGSSSTGAGVGRQKVFGGQLQGIVQRYLVDFAPGVDAFLRFGAKMNNEIQRTNLFHAPR
jgi:hypothetical protein